MNFHTHRNGFTFINNLSRLSLLNGDKAEYDMVGYTLESY